MEQINKYYAVMKLISTINVNGIEQPLPEGEFVIPVFKDYNMAVEHSFDKYEIE